MRCLSLCATWSCPLLSSISYFLCMTMCHGMAVLMRKTCQPAWCSTYLPLIFLPRDEPVCGMCDRPRTRYCPPGLCTCLSPSMTSGRMRPSRSTCAHPGGTPHTCPPMSTLSPRTMVRRYPDCRFRSRIRLFMRDAILSRTLASQGSAPWPVHAALHGELQTLHGSDAGLPGKAHLLRMAGSNGVAHPYPCTCLA